MTPNRPLRNTFFLSLAGHTLLLSSPLLQVPVIKPEFIEEKSVVVEIEIPQLLPPIQELAEVKKLKEIESDEILDEDFTFEEVIIEHPPVEEVPEVIPEVIPHDEPVVREEKIEVKHPDEEGLLRYQDKIKQMIQSKRRYPSWAKRQEVEGKVYLSFVVLSDGQLRDATIVQSSQEKILDDAALRALHRAAPFPPIPHRWNQKELFMETSLNFYLN